MKKIISLILVVLIILAVPIFAVTNGMVQVGNKIGDKTSYNVGVEVKKGWNLITGVTGDVKISRTSDIQLSDIKSIYAFNPLTKHYAKMYPNPGTADVNEIRSIEGDELISSAFWVYSNREGYIKFTSEYLLDLNKRNMYAGWNFVGVTPEFTEKSFSSLKGNCEVQEAYIYNNKVYAGHQAPSWERVREDTVFREGLIGGVGFIMKVRNNCKLNSVDAAVPLPALPA